MWVRSASGIKHGPTPLLQVVISTTQRESTSGNITTHTTSRVIGFGGFGGDWMHYLPMPTEARQSRMIAMIFSARHYSALGRVYSETFGQQVPREAAHQAARTGRAQALMEALDNAIKSNDPIQDWSPYAG